MSEASFRNLGSAVRERDRRIALSLASPGTPGVAQAGYLMPSWDAFYGSQREQAGEGGYRLSGAGTSLGGDPQGTTSRPGDEDSARSLAINGYLGRLADENRLRAQSEKDMAAHNNSIAQAERDRQSVERAAAIANTPGASAGGKPIVGGNGTYATQDAPAGNPQQIAAQMAPGLIAPPQAKPVTFDDPKPLMIDGKRTMTRAGSDGQLYTMDRRPITSGIAPDEAPGGVTTTPEAVELAARNYLTTGQMPPLGMGDKTTRQAILNKAAELGGAGANIAANKADYRADSGSLTKMQGQRDAIGAFEETAGKNIDIFLNAAGKIVDSGSPLANQIARNVSGKMLGSPDQAAYDAARQVAINEIAKITANPTLAGQLSDSARHEVDAFNPKGATLAQTVAVMRLLKQDMGNRITSLDEGLKNIKGRIRPDVPPAPAGFVDMIDPNGNALHVPAGDVEKLTKLGAKRKGGG